MIQAQIFGNSKREADPTVVTQKVKTKRQGPSPLSHVNVKGRTAPFSYDFFDFFFLLRLLGPALKSQVGLVIGKLSSTLDRGFVFDLVPTPQNDAGEPACSVLEPAKDNRKKGSKPKSQTSDSSSSLVIDKDWSLNMLASEAAFKNSTMVICQTVKGVAEAASFLDDDIDERLLIHICYSPRR
ncbi:hypothetical protein CRYUN_Cryun35bG0046100 [Craigia yunnanensis]